MTGHNPRGPAPESVPPLTGMPTVSVHPQAPLSSPLPRREPAAALSDDDRAQLLYGSYRGTRAALPGAIPPPWDKLPEADRTGWNGVARTAFQPLATLRAQNDELRRQLADDKLTHAEYRQTALELLASARAELAREKRERLQYAGELGAARSELSRLLRFFKLTGGTWTARVRADVLGRLAVNGGVKVPDGIPQQPSDADVLAHHGRACTAVGEVRAAIAMLNGQAASEAEAIDLIESSIARFDKDGGR